MKTRISKNALCTWLQASEKKAIVLILSGMIAFARPAAAQDASTPGKIVVIAGLMNGQTLKGRLVYADSTSLMIWSGKGKLRPGSDQKHSFWLPEASVDYVSLKENGSEFKNFIAGLGSRMLISSSILGSAVNSSIIGFNYISTTSPSNYPFASPDSDSSISVLKSALDVTVFIGGDSLNYLSALDLLKQYSLQSLPPQEWKPSSDKSIVHY